MSSNSEARVVNCNLVGVYGYLFQAVLLIFVVLGVKSRHSLSSQAQL